MANAFMPSGFATAAQAGAQTLEQTLAEREFNRRLAEHQMQLQRQAFMDQFTVAMRLQDQGQQERAFKYRVDQDAADAKAKADEKATKQRELTNQRGAQDIFVQGVQSGAKREDLMRAAIDGKVPVSMMPKEPTKEKTLAERISERKALRTADKEVDAKFKTPKATKVAAADEKAPPALVSEIESYKNSGLAGWKTVGDAQKSIEANWSKLRAKFGNKLSRSAMQSALVNVYGTRPKGENSMADALARIEAELSSNKP